MKKLLPPIACQAKSDESHITDAVLFFSETTVAYEQFEQNILNLLHNLSTLSLQQLRTSCRKLRQEKARLEVFDQQILDIIDLAGRSISEDPIIDEYRLALAKAKKASNTLAHELRAIRAILSEIAYADLDFEEIL